MLGIADFWAFSLAVLVFLMLPGPGTFALLTSTGKGGFKGGAASTFGVILGDQVLLWSAVAGLSALMAAYPVLFKAVQWAGAGYLIWIGFQLLVAKDGAAPVVNIEVGQYFRQSFFITLLNPKAIIFYMAFFPQFVNPATHQGVITFAAMAVTIAVISLVYCLALCALADRVADKVRQHRKVAKALERLAGVFLVGFGIKLATSK
jgi:threonine/homoserine/homoserine lactone efflux protein